MSTKPRKTNQDLDFLNRRLDGVRMSDCERLVAKAHLARAEAIAGAAASAFHLVKRALKRLAPRPVRRPTTSAG